LLNIHYDPKELLTNSNPMIVQKLVKATIPIKAWCKNFTKLYHFIVDLKEVQCNNYFAPEAPSYP
jgi:hypothetical protein